MAESIMKTKPLAAASALTLELTGARGARRMTFKASAMTKGETGGTGSAVIVSFAHAGGARRMAAITVAIHQRAIIGA